MELHILWYKTFCNLNGNLAVTYYNHSHEACRTNQVDGFDETRRWVIVTPSPCELASSCLHQLVRKRKVDIAGLSRAYPPDKLLGITRDQV